MEKPNRLPTSAVIIVTALILGGSYYLTQLNKQASIEQEKMFDRMESAARLQQEYEMEQKDACLEIYKTESDKWTNVRSWSYDKEDDECSIVYKDPKPKTKDECAETYPVGGDYGYYNLTARAHCLDGNFSNTF